MPATSQAQQKLMGQAYALKKGDLKPEDLNPEYRAQIEDLAKGMTLKQLKDYAETSHENLPKKVKEMKNIPTFEAFIDEAKELDLKINEGSDPQEQIKKNCIERLSQFFRVPGSRLMKFKFDGKDDVRQYTDALDATSYEGAEAYYKIAIKLAKEDLGIRESLNEAGDLAYWKQYEVDNSKEAEGWENDKVKTISDLVSLIDKCIISWNKNASREGTDRISKPSEKHIGDLSMKFFKKFGYINGAIIQAMIMQES